MAELRRLEINYSKDYHTAFEDLSTLIFCTYLDLEHGVNRRINQKGIEADPVSIGNRTYAYQAKYFDAATSLVDKKRDFINSIEAARQKGVTHLLFFINKDLPDTNSQTNEEPLFLKKINEFADGDDNNNPIKLEWWTRSNIETSLDMPRYRYIREIFLCGTDSNIAGYSSFYNYIYDRFSKVVENELYGNVSLLDFYIEPFITDDYGRNLSVREYIESFKDDKKIIAVICGEPGHGKTSLCQKAMCDFYKNGWLATRVSNVFCFSLNPANTDALAHDSFYLYSLLSWGDDRKSPDQRIKKDACNNALIFFDGFDELLEWYPELSLNSFINDYIVPFQKETNAHVVITSRNMAVEPFTRIYESFIKDHSVSIKKLQLITKDQQIKWIKQYIRNRNSLLLTESVQNNHKKRKEIENELREINKYLEDFMLLNIYDQLRDLLGIPIIFRMMVFARYLPKANLSITELYNNLFHMTWIRRRHNSKGRYTDLENETKANLSRHALNIFAENNDTAVVNSSMKSLWLFSFYTTHEKENRVGFIHRSIYHYFLAIEFLSWFKTYVLDKDEDIFRERLSLLARRKIDRTTLWYLRELYEVDELKNQLAVAYEKSYEILKQTDGIIEISRYLDSQGTFEEKNNYSDIAAHIEQIAPLERANNVFWNIVSIWSIVGKKLSYDKIH